MKNEKIQLKIDRLKTDLPQNSTVYTQKVGTRKYVVLIVVNNEIRNITIPAKIICGKPLLQNGDEYWKVSGHGFNLPASIVETLSYTLYQKPDALKWSFP